MNKLLSEIQDYLEYYQDVYGDSIIIEKIDAPSDNAKVINTIVAENKQMIDNMNFNNENQKVKKENNKIIKENINTKKTSDNWEEATSLEDLFACIADCQSCKLCNTRNKIVFGSGNPNADIMVIGEGPGADEDASGLPFVGRAGQLLTKILEAIQLSREEVYIANIVKCRPPNNRRPETDEVNSCEPYLIKQIELIKPKFILALGLTALETLFKQKFRMADARGKLMEYHGIKTLATYHPAALLRNPNLKRDTWEDVKLLRKLYLESKEN